MKPIGVLVEQFSGVEGGGEVERASIVMVTDSAEGVFFGGYTANHELRLLVDSEDARTFNRTKSQSKKAKIIDKYAVRVEGTDRYLLPYGGLVGRMAVGGVLEVNHITSQRA